MLAQVRAAQPRLRRPVKWCAGWLPPQRQTVNSLFEKKPVTFSMFRF